MVRDPYLLFSLDDLNHVSPGDEDGPGGGSIVGNGRLSLAKLLRAAQLADEQGGALAGSNGALRVSERVALYGADGRGETAALRVEVAFVPEAALVAAVALPRLVFVRPCGDCTR